MDNELNFNARAQSAFDNLNDATDWTWSGLAKAFARRYELPDMEELKDAIELDIEAKRKEL
jgi:hypothetical protein